MSLVGNFTANDDRENRFNGVAAKGSKGERDYAADESSGDEETPEEAQRRADQEVAGLARTMSRRSDAAHTSSDDPLRPTPDSQFDPWSDNFNARAWSKAVWSLTNLAHRTAGVAFENLGAHGYGTDSDYQSTVGNMPLKAFGMLKGLVSRNKGRRVQILEGVDGLLEPGDMLVVLGPPGRCVLLQSLVLQSCILFQSRSDLSAADSRRRRARSGCSTFLKTLAGETQGFKVDPESNINYKGITPEQMKKNLCVCALLGRPRRRERSLTPLLSPFAAPARQSSAYSSSLVLHARVRGPDVSSHSSAETEQHFPQLTVGQTLEFAAEARAVRPPPPRPLFLATLSVMCK